MTTPRPTTLVLSASVGTGPRMWDPQRPAFEAQFDVVALAHPGHGGKPAPPGPYTMEWLAGRALAELDARGVGEFAWCGLSLGGAVGLQLALDHPDRVTSLVLCCSSAWFGGPQPWLDRAARVRAEGLGFLVELARGRWFRPDHPLPPGGDDLLRAQLELDPEGYAGCCEALAAFDARDRLAAVAVPTRVIAGAVDPATPAPMTDLLAAGIPGADLVVLPEAAHLATVENPAPAQAAILQHLTGQS